MDRLWRINSMMKNWRTIKPISLYNIGFKLLAVFTCHHTSHHGCWPKPTTPRDSLVGWCIIVPGKIAGFQGMFPQPDDLSILSIRWVHGLEILGLDTLQVPPKLQLGNWGIMGKVDWRILAYLWGQCWTLKPSGRFGSESLPNPEEQSFYRSFGIII